MMMLTIDATGGLATIGNLDQKESLDEIENRGLTEVHDLIVPTEILEILASHEVPHPIANHHVGKNHEDLLEILVLRVRQGLLLQVLPPALL